MTEPDLQVRYNGFETIFLSLTLLSAPSPSPTCVAEGSLRPAEVASRKVKYPT